MRRCSTFGFLCFTVLFGTALSSLAIADVKDSSSKCAAAIEKAAGKHAACLLAARSGFTLNRQEDSLKTKMDRCHKSFDSRFRRALRKSGEEHCSTIDSKSIEQATLIYTAHIVSNAQGKMLAVSANENDLFNQPDDDNTCGIRQLLLAQDELTGNQRYTGDILALWRDVRAITLENYPPGTLARLIGVDEEPKFTRALPETYDVPSVEAAEGGPETLPSSAITAASTLGLRFERFYLDRENVSKKFGSALVDQEVSLVEAFAQGSVVDYQVGKQNLSELISNPNHYYMIVINKGTHWVGATTRTVNDSLATGPVPSEPELDSLQEFGIIMEFSLQP